MKVTTNKRQNLKQRKLFVVFFIKNHLMYKNCICLHISPLCPTILQNYIIGVNVITILLYLRYLPSFF